VPRDRGQSRGGLAVPGCPALGSAGQSPSEQEALYPVAYVLQDLLTVASRVVHTRAELVGLPEANTGAEVLRASLSAPRARAARDARDTSQSVLGVSWRSGTVILERRPPRLLRAQPGGCECERERRVCALYA
jgi:hypothetical protein